MNRQEWLKWRKQGIGSSEAAIIMGVSPWGTALSLYEEKLSEDVQEGSNFILDKGNNIEPKIRALFEIMRGYPYTEKLCEMEGIPYIRASLDGFSTVEDAVFEAKLLSTGDNPEAEGYKKWIALRDENKIPEEYFPQVQHQLMVTGASKAFLVGAHIPDPKEQLKIKNLAVGTVFPDVEYQKTLLKKEIEFWNYVQTRTPPPLSDKDYANLRTKGVKKLTTDFIKIKNQIDSLSEKLEEAREALIKIAEEGKHPRYTAFDLIRIRRETRIGNVNYKSIPELKGVNLDKYRGKPSQSWRVEVIKK